MYPSWRNNYLRYRSYFLNVMGRYKERTDIRAYLEILLSLTTISIFSIFALRPTLLTIAELIKEIDSKEETISKMEQKIGNLAQAQTLFDKERPRIILLGTSIPNLGEPVVFARQVEGLSSKYQPAILGISTGGTNILGQDFLSKAGNKEKAVDPLPEGAEELSYSFELTSAVETYNSLTNFLSDFENLRMLGVIDSLKVSTEEDSGKKSLIMSVEGRLPYYIKVD